MASDGLVSPRMVLRALTRLQHQGSAPLLRELETHEPELAEFVMEQLSELHHRLWGAGLDRRTSKRLYRDTERLVLAALAAMRDAQTQLLDGMSAGDERPGDDTTSDEMPEADGGA